ncbi:hypothetical protein N7519_009177, partial [Penicillium mononematosum]|uniref:uncharacterized protein n=1 Tax=Penicillium mononematosum TaxID=268346 RepID=UPI0025490B7A
FSRSLHTPLQLASYAVTAPPVDAIQSTSWPVESIGIRLSDLKQSKFDCLLASCMPWAFSHLIQPKGTQVAIVFPPPKYRVRTQRGAKLSRNCSRWTIVQRRSAGDIHSLSITTFHKELVRRNHPRKTSSTGWINIINKFNGRRFSLDCIVALTQFIKEPSLTIQSAVGDRPLRLIGAVITVWGILNLPLDTACCEWPALSQEADLERLRTY